MADLAILGGAPTFCEPLHVGRPNAGDRAAFLRRVESMLDRNWLTNDGPLVREFESRIRETTHTAHAVVVANGTLGLSLLASALGLSGEVIMPSFTFVGTAHAVRWLGLRPRFCDVDATTHTLDPGKLTDLITERTAAVMPVHLWGNICDVSAIEAIAHEAQIPVMYDAAHALECGRAGRAAGGFGRAEVFSFHATKFVHAFEGGAITTDDDDLAERLRLMRNFGFAGYDRIESLGTNAKMSEVSAAMGLTVLESVDEIITRNTENRAAYESGIADVPGLSIVGTGDNDRHNLQYVVVHVDQSATGVDRDKIVEALWAEGVRARRYFSPGCHRAVPYVESGGDLDLDVTERLCDEVVVLPTGLAITPDVALTVSGLMGRIVESATAIGCSS